MTSVHQLHPASTMTDVRRRAPWVGAEPAAAHVVAAAAGLLLATAIVEILVRDSIGLVVGVALVLAAVAAALLVPVRNLFTAGVLPPLLLLALLVVVAVVYPDGIGAARLAASASVPQRVIAGFVDLAGALVVAHGLALLLVALRARVAHRNAPAGRVNPAVSPQRQ